MPANSMKKKLKLLLPWSKLSEIKMRQQSETTNSIRFLKKSHFVLSQGGVIRVGYINLNWGILSLFMQKTNNTTTKTITIEYNYYKQQIQLPTTTSITIILHPTTSYWLTN